MQHRHLASILDQHSASAFCNCISISTCIEHQQSALASAFSNESVQWICTQPCIIPRPLVRRSHGATDQHSASAFCISILHQHSSPAFSTSILHQHSSPAFSTRLGRRSHSAQTCSGFLGYHHGVGRWTSPTYMTYIHAHIWCISQGFAVEMSQHLTFHIVG